MRLLPVVAVIGALTAQVARGQSVPDQTALATLDAAIPPGVLPAVPRGEDGVTRQIQGAMANFAKYVRENDRRAAEKALFSLDQAAIRRKEWAWPTYSMARVFLTLHEREAMPLDSDGKVEGEPHLSAMWRQLAAALDRDPTHALSRKLLVDLAYAGGDRELPASVRTAIERDLHTRGTSPRTWIVHGRALRLEGRHAFALAAFERAALLGGDPSVTALERARTLRTLGDTIGAVRAYWSGAEDLTTEGRIAYQKDLEWIVSVDSLAGLRAASNAGFSAWLRRFWAERDAAAVRARDERLTEHLRRWGVAHAEFRVPLPWKRTFYSRFWGIAGGTDCVANASRWVDSLPLHAPTLDGDPRFREPLLDHRAFVYMRHGEPYVRTDVAVGSDTTLADADQAAVTIGSWVYWVEGEWRAFHFAGSDVFGSHAPTTLRSYLPLNWGAWMALASELPEYARTALFLDPERFSGQPKTCYSTVQVAVNAQRADASVATTTDSDSPLITRPWNAPLRFFALGTEADGSSRALVTFAFAGRDLVSEALADGSVRYAINFRIVAFDATSGRTITIDTVRNFRHAATLRPTQYLTGWFEIPLDGGMWQLSMRAMQDDALAGAYGVRRGLVVDRGQSLALSDVVTGLTGSPESWLASGEAFPLNTLGAWRLGSNVELYYEVRGLRSGDPYTSTLQVLPADRRAKGSVSVRAQEEAAGPLTAVRRTLGLARLPAGTYRLVVTIEAGGQTVKREQEIVVVDQR